MRETEAELFERAPQDLINAIVNTAIKKKYATAIYRLPGKTDIIAIIDFRFSPAMGPFYINDQAGFILSPFLNKEEKNFFIRADLVFDFGTRKVKAAPEVASIAADFIEEMRGESPSGFFMEEREEKHEDIPRGHYQTITEEAIRKIRNREIQKVVLARKKKVALPEGWNPGSLFSRISTLFPDSFISLVKVPGAGMWVGSSPELLASIDRNNIFRTVALAGTQQAKTDDVHQAGWTHKEIEEQALVCRYIINCFKSIRLREYTETGPKTVRTGNIFHLKTEYSVDLNTHHYPDLYNMMLKLLHPTSAVCGMPREDALEFIRQQEKLDRKFYSGYLGPVNMDGECHIFVNIRCSEINGSHATVFAGAGVTEESVPEREWLETELKMQAMENIITRDS